MRLQILCYALLVTLGIAYVVLDGFDLGIGMLLPVLGRSPSEREELRAMMGPFWDGNEVWLVVLVGATFATFPRAYAGLLSGFYIPLLLVLFGLILRAVSFAFHSATDPHRWLWTAGLVVGSLVPAFVLGLVAGDVVSGVPLNRLGFIATPTFSVWTPLGAGAALLALAAFAGQGTSWAALGAQGELYDRVIKARAWANGLFAASVIVLVTIVAAVAPGQFRVVLSRPLGWMALAALLGGLLGARLSAQDSRDRAAFAWSSLSVASLPLLMAATIFPALLPSSTAAPSLTLFNASSSQLTLAIMLGVAILGIPVVIAYTAVIYRTFAFGSKRPAARDVSPPENVADTS
jgi:cytochrome bd ubiquinol oxidase subunit II